MVSVSALTARIAISILLASSLLAATDTTSEVMRAYCISFLNLGAGQANNSSAPIPIANLTNFTYSKQYYAALADIAEANNSIRKMKAAGIPSLRASDSLLQAEAWFDGQAALEIQSGGTSAGDYKFVTNAVLDIKDLERKSFSTNDELAALQKRIEQADLDANLSSALQLQADAKKEFDDNRFEEAETLINNAYDKIAQSEADATRSRTLLEAASRNIAAFLHENWPILLGGIIAVAAALFVFQKQIRRIMVNARVNALVAEKGVLEHMIQNLQKEYFEHGKVNELSYHIKTKKFGDLIRNINRQLPLLREELKRI